MENKELKDALDALKVSLEGKAAAEAKAVVDAFKDEYKELLDVDFKGMSEKLNDLESLPTNIKTMQDHLDKMDVRIQSKEKQPKAGEDIIKNLIVENFDQIKDVVRKKKVYVEDTKAVGNMTLGNNLTGDQPRTFSSDVAKVPNQISNFSDLIGVINIGNGTYTFPREGAGEGAAATQTEGSDKAQIDTDIAMIDVNTDFIAGYQVYSKKMANNLPFLESFLPGQLRRKYFDAENSVFNTALAAAATASTQVITGINTAEMLINEIATLEAANFTGNTGIVVSPAQWHNLLKLEKSTGAGYGLPLGYTFDGGVLRCLGVPVVKANWLADTNKYFVGDWSTVKKVVTEGLSVQFSTEDEDNFRKNNITARVEAQVGIAIHRPDAIIYGDFTAT